jgi:hypothetical protein
MSIKREVRVYAIKKAPLSAFNYFTKVRFLYFFLLAKINCSRAATMLGVCG